MSASRIVKWAIPVSLILLFPLVFGWMIAHYHTHFEASILAYPLGFVGLAGCAAGFAWAGSRRERSLAILYGIAAVSCVFFCYWTARIPFCVDCDGIGRDDLGFMLKPFADVFGTT